MSNGLKFSNNNTYYTYTRSYTLNILIHRHSYTYIYKSTIFYTNGTTMVPYKVTGKQVDRSEIGF